MPASTLLSLPAEIRLQIYEYVIGYGIVHVRMTWSGICIPTGFAYSCLKKTESLLETNQNDTLADAVPFGRDVIVLNLVCRQIYEEASVLPFRLYVWAFESAFTLDQFVCMKRKIPTRCKIAIKTVAVPTPGPHQSSERKLTNLASIFLIGSDFRAVEEGSESRDTVPARAILPLRKSLANGTWVRDDNIARFV
ncbi:hypothetical protein ACN47E_008835 [Coniothyrium glycines]